jgi:N-acetylglucosamine-6-phosphate deacetylase
MRKAYTASQIFTGEEWLKDHAIMVNNETIESVLPLTQLSKDVEVQSFPGRHIIPGFIDAQVYGAGGRLLSVFPDAITLKVMSEEFLKTGTLLCMPTLATNTLDIFRKAIDAVRAYWKSGGQGIYGLHLEGPWINAEKRGAHIKDLIHAPEVKEVQELLEYGKGIIKMITIAPEVCSDEIIALMRSYEVILSAGHSNATYQQAVNSFDKGITTVTHLYNAMSPLHHREPGLVGAALNHHQVMASIIPDGYHVDFSAISIAKKIMKERLFAITDAVTETTAGPYQHQLAGGKYESNGILSGSAISMHQAMLNLMKEVKIEKEEAIRMCSLYPAQMMNCANKYGRIAPGYTAQFLVLDKDLSLAEVLSAQKIG